MKCILNVVFVGRLGGGAAVGGVLFCRRKELWVYNGLWRELRVERRTSYERYLDGGEGEEVEEVEEVEEEERIEGMGRIDYTITVEILHV